MTSPKPTPEALLELIQQLIRTGQLSHSVNELKPTIETPFFDMHLDSIEIVTLLSEIELTFNVELPNRNEFPESLTLGDLVSIISSQISHQENMGL
ncbi:putative Acyl carrier protein [Gammaproteobacteria bacterium]